MSHGHPHSAPPPARHSTSADPLTTARPRAALLLLCLAQFMLIVDITVVQVALPAIGHDLDLTRATLTWVVTTYTLCFGGLMVFGGRLVDAFGPRRVLMTGLAVFTAASLACGLAPSGSVLIAGRAVQGVGAALMSPAALAVITTSFHGPHRNRALGVWAAIGGTGAAVGVLVGGILTAGPGWEWVFHVNVPIGALVLIALPAVVPRTTPAAHRPPLDVPGAVLVTAATALLIYALVTSGDSGWKGPAALVPLLLSATLFAAFAAVERRAPAPLMHTRTLVRRPVIAGMVIMLVATGLMLALFFLGTLYLQRVSGFSALETGLAFLPVAVAITAGARLAGHVIGRIGARPVAAAGFAVTAAGIALMTGISPDGGLTGLLPGFVIAAFGIGPGFVAATTTALADVPAEEAGVASGIVTTFHELGGSIGVAAVSAVAAASLAPGATGTGGFTVALTAAAATAAVSAIAAFVLVPPGRPPAGAAGHGHGHGVH